MKHSNLVKLDRGTPKELERALLEKLPALLPSMRILNTSHPKGPQQVDLILNVSTPLGHKRELYVEVKGAIPLPSRVRESLRQMKAAIPKRSQGYPVLASRFLSPRVREICREEGVGYLDLAGNCFLQFEDFHLEKVVDKNPFPQPGRPASLFTPVSSRILRAFLEEPERVWKLKELAQTVHVSMGQTSNVLRRLREEEYLKKEAEGFHLTQPAKLLGAWQEEYSFEKNAAFPYYSFERNPEKIMTRLSEIGPKKRLSYAVTSFAAAGLVAPFVRGVGVVHWYIEDQGVLGEWLKALELRPAEAGPNAVILLPYDKGVFYRVQSIKGTTLVGNVQLYLDLHSDPARGREQAEFLRKKKLRF
jgi:hypothetical protein